MEELIFLVQGSEQEPYQVSIRKLANNLTAKCTCRAGYRRCRKIIIKFDDQLTIAQH